MVATNNGSTAGAVTLISAGANLDLPDQASLMGLR
jgi:hypothetical protein